MNRLLLLLLLLAASAKVMAQKAFILARQPKNGFVSVGAGLSLPLGRFADGSATTPGAGLALRGHATHIAIGYRVLGPVGLMVRAEQSQLTMQTSQLPDRQRVGTWQATAGHWQTTAFMAGPFVHIPLDRFSIDARFLAGQVLAVCPEVKLAGQIPFDGPQTIRTAEARSVAFACGAGISVRYRLGRVIAVQINADYSQADVPFMDMRTIAESGSRSQITVANSRQHIQTLSASAGFTFLFGDRQRVF
jgi:hypothetical protein